MLKQYLCCFIVFNVIFLNKTCAQPLLTDTALNNTAINNVIQLYKDSVKENLRLYNGYEFPGIDVRISGHPFFEYSQPQKGDIFYNDMHYPNVLLSYDIIYDKVIFSNPLKDPDLQLLTNKIDWFTIQDHLFVNAGKDINTANFPGSGFYELLYTGPASVFVKRKKQFDQSIKADEPSKFIQWTWYYVKKNEAYYEVNSGRSLLAVCKDHKSEVVKLMKKESLNFKKDPVNTLIKVFAYYNTLRTTK